MYVLTYRREGLLSFFFYLVSDKLMKTKLSQPLTPQGSMIIYNRYLFCFGGGGGGGGNSPAYEFNQTAHR